ncbi:MAG: acetate/propionate family kinase [Chloroflexi bacterium]|nr:acetate/propionate family kinase [Chloroflexota bacterium]
MRVLVLNPGSSTLKAAVVEPPGRRALATATVEWGPDASRASGRATGVADVLSAVEAAGVARGSIDAVGHRVVHGGTRFVYPTLLEDATVNDIEALAPLAPLHTRISVDTIRAARRALPGIPHVAAFDTAFHADLPPAGYRYPVPEAWYRDWGIRRFGFHGLSVAWSVTRAAELLGRPVAGLRLVVAHLGSGCSVTAVDGGRSVDTSMGMTPLEGLMMGTRAGSIDPGILLALLGDGRASPAELEDVLDHRSGLLGVSGHSADVRELLIAEGAGDSAATLALKLFVRRAAAAIAAAATCLPAIDAVVFTGGIGENAGRVRARIAASLAVLGIPSIPDGDVDEDMVLTDAAKAPAVARIKAREDIVIAEAVRSALLYARAGRRTSRAET